MNDNEREKFLDKIVKEFLIVLGDEVTKLICADNLPKDRAEKRRLLTQVEINTRETIQKLLKEKLEVEK